VQTNSYGLRDGKLDPSASVRILLLGDSMTFGHGVNHEETFEYLLERSLTRSLNKQVVIINAGHNGYDTRREFEYLRHFAIRFRPTDVIVAFTLNDVYSNSGEYWFSPVPTGFGRYVPLAGVAALTAYLEQPKTLLRKLGFNIEGGRNVDHLDCLRDNGRCDRGWESTYSYINKIVKFSKERGVNVVLVHVPILHQIRYKYGTPPYDMGRASRKLERLSKLVGIHFIDIARSDSLSADHYFPKDGHLNSDGHKVAAKYLHERMRTQSHWGRWGINTD
jgi:hypothetical protein